MQDYARREYNGPKKINFGTKLWFGKHKGYTIHYVLEDDPSYLAWCIESIDGFAEHLVDGIDAKIEEACAEANRSASRVRE
jgi:hypothetical protein